MKAIKIKEFLEQLLKISSKARQSIQVKLPFYKDEVILFEYENGSADVYVKIASPSENIIKRFGKDFYINVYVTNLKTYGPKSGKKQVLNIDTQTSRTKSGGEFYKFYFYNLINNNEPVQMITEIDPLDDLRTEIESKINVLTARIEKLELTLRDRL